VQTAHLGAGGGSGGGSDGNRGSGGSGGGVGALGTECSDAAVRLLNEVAPGSAAAGAAFLGGALTQCLLHSST